MSNRFQTRFLVVGTYRSGTSAIVEAIGRHPRVLCGMEWTHQLPMWRKIAVGKAALAGDFSGLLPKNAEQVKKAWTAQQSVIGFKRLFRSSDKWLLHPRLAPALAVDRLEAHLKWAQSDPALRIIHVVRQDNVAWLKSKALADATGRFSGARYPDDVQLTLSPHEARKRVATKLWIDGRLASLSVTNPYLRLNHEEFLNDNLTAAARLVTFLGCDPSELPAIELRHQPQSRASSATLKNVEEIRTALGIRARLVSDTQTGS